MTPKTTQVLKDLRARLERIYGDRLVKLVLYGSRARGDADAESDIDVLVVLRGQVALYDEIQRTSEDMADLLLEWGELVSCVFLSEEDYLRQRSPLMLNVRREGVGI